VGVEYEKEPRRKHHLLLVALRRRGSLRVQGRAAVCVLLLMNQMVLAVLSMQVLLRSLPPPRPSLH
jgi:hypothetical protein